MERSSVNQSRATRALYLVLGCLFLALGVIGAMLPVIPTTGPLLIALWFFARGSARLHDWLYFHPWLGPPLQQWKQERVIPVKVKATAYGSMGLSFGALSLAGSSFWILTATALFMLAGVIYIASCPSKTQNNR